MWNAQGRLAGIAAATAVALALPSSRAAVSATPGANRNQRWNHFSADVSIRRVVRGPGHQPSENDAPPVMYRWERTQSAGRWTSIVRIVSSGRPDVTTPTGSVQPIPPVIARIEDDEDGSGPRFYSLQGTVVHRPTSADRRKMGAPDSAFAKTDALVRPSALLGPSPARLKDDDGSWVETVLPSFEKAGARRLNLQRRLGKVLGTLRGLDRYVQTVDDETTEVLADTRWAVPLEINVVRQGALRSHASFVYDSADRGALVRRRAHAEHIFPERQGVRMVLDVELANVRLEDRK